MELRAANLGAVGIVFLEAVCPVDTHQSDHGEEDSHAGSCRLLEFEGIDSVYVAPGVSCLGEGEGVDAGGSLKHDGEPEFHGQTLVGIAIAGGVASNSALRETIMNAASKKGIEVLFPAPVLCTDNAAMIGSAAYFNLVNGKISDLNLNAKPNLKL